jgi:integrase
MSRSKNGVPSLRRHKARSLGVVTLNGHDHYLGRWPEGLSKPPAEVQAAYDRLITQWLADGRRPQPSAEQRRRDDLAGRPADAPQAGLTVAELIARFWQHAEAYYRHTNGEPTGELNDWALSLRPLNHLYGHTPARRFRPKRLKGLRQLLIQGYEHPRYGPQKALCRGVINQRIGRIVRMFRWGVEEELVPARVWQRLSAVRRLQKGRTEARETERVRPVPVADVEKTLPHLLSHPAAMVRLQLLTGARPGEVCALRLANLDRSGPVWAYRPPHHKTAWRDKERVVAIGPRAQQVLNDFIRIRCPLCGVEGRPPRIGARCNLCGPCADRMEERRVCGPWPRVEVQPPEAYLFSPAAVMLERREDRRAKRTSKVQPSQVDRRKKAPEKTYGEEYPVNSYNTAVQRAAEKAGVAPWHVNQLRHTHATEVRRRYGLEAAQVALGHSQANVTQVYAEADLALAVRVASEIG